jgi:hypothetical protein
MVVRRTNTQSIATPIKPITIISTSSKSVRNPLRASMTANPSLSLAN